MLYWSARLGETRCGSQHPLETFTSSVRRSIHPPGSVSLLPFQLLGLFLCRCGLAARESDTSFCHGFTIADIWSATLRVVTPAATFPEALSLVQEQQSWVWLRAGKPVKTRVCCRRGGKLFPWDVISLISLTYVIFKKWSEFLFDSWYPSLKHCSLSLMHESTSVHSQMMFSGVFPA